MYILKSSCAKSLNLGLAVYVCNHSPQETEGEDYHKESENSLLYMKGSRPSKDTKEDPVSKLKILF